jgi:hypothetical protein
VVLLLRKNTHAHSPADGDRALAPESKATSLQRSQVVYIGDRTPSAAGFAMRRRRSPGGRSARQGSAQFRSERATDRPHGHSSLAARGLGWIGRLKAPATDGVEDHIMLVTKKATCLLKTTIGRPEQKAGSKSPVDPPRAVCSNGRRATARAPAVCIHPMCCSAAFTGSHRTVDSNLLSPPAVRLRPPTATAATDRRPRTSRSRRLIERSTGCSDCRYCLVGSGRR